MRHFPHGTQQARVAMAIGVQQAFVRGVVNGIILSAALWAAAIYVATVLR